MNTYFSTGHGVQRFGQTVPVGLAAEQAVHDDQRRLLADVGRRLVGRVRHFDRFRFAAGAQPPPASSFRRARPAGEERHGPEHRAQCDTGPKRPTWIRRTYVVQSRSDMTETGRDRFRQTE